jgi:dGTPase
MFQVLRKSMSLMISDVVSQSIINIKYNNINTFEDCQNHNDFIILFSNSMSARSKEIKSFLFDNVYNHNKLQQKRLNVENIVSNLFKYFYNTTNKLPKDWQNKNEPLERIICDYISGMTDRYATRLHKELYE